MMYSALMVAADPGNSRDSADSAGSARPSSSAAGSGPGPGPIDPTETLRFSSSGDIQLYGEYFAARTPGSPRAAALIAHGYFEHCGRYRELANVVTGMGLAALSYDMRGHGRSDGPRGHIDEFGDYLDDLDAALDALDRQCPDAIPRLLIGHSNGGLTVLRALADPDRQPNRVAAAVVSSPFLGFKAKVPVAKDIFGRAAGRLLPKFSLPSPLDLEELTSDRQKQEERRLDTLCHEAASARWYIGALEAHQYVARHAAAIDVPTLWLVAEGDRIADPAVSRAVRARLRRTSRYVSLTGMQHEVFNERERGRVFDLLGDFIKETFH